MQAHAAFITYEFSNGGRFGDCLVAYSHAKWVSYYLSVPFLYRPFRYSEELVMEDLDEPYDKYAYICQTLVVLSGDQEIYPESNDIYSYAYFPEIMSDLEKWSGYIFEVDWKDHEFRRTLREMIKPKKDIQEVCPPANTLSIAIHIREGGGFDPTELHFLDPLKFPPVTYYADCLNEVLVLFPGKPIFCYIFTDALEVDPMVEFLKESVPKDTSIVFEYRRQMNRHDAHVLEDFFSLLNFDVLIRPESNFSLMASRIHDFRITCSPESYSIYQHEGNKVVKIEKFQIHMN